MSGKLKIFLAHSGRQEDLDLIETSSLQVHLRDMLPGKIDLIDRTQIDPDDVVGGLQDAKMILHLISADYPDQEDPPFFLQVLEAIQNYQILSIPLLLRPRSEAAWLMPLYNNEPQQLLLDRPLSQWENGLEDGAFTFSDRLRPLLPQIEEILPPRPDLPLIPSEKLVSAMSNLNFSKQRTKFKNEFDWEKQVHLVYVQGTPECGHDLLLHHLCKSAGIYPSRSALFRINLSIHEAVPTEFSVWDRLAETLYLDSFEFIAPEMRQNAVLKKIRQQLNGDSATDQVFYLTFENNRGPTRKKLQTFWKEFNQAFRDNSLQGRLFFFVLDQCGISERDLQEWEQQCTRDLLPLAEVLPLPPIEPVNRNVLFSWVHEQFDEEAAPKLQDVLQQEIDQVISNYQYIRKLIYFLCNLFSRRDIYQNLFENEKI